MEKRIEILGKMYLFLIFLISIFYFTRSTFIENFKNSIYGIKSFSLLFKVNKKIIILNEKGKWLYVFFDGFSEKNYVYFKNLFRESKGNIVIVDNTVEIKNFDNIVFYNQDEIMEKFLKILPDSCLCIVYLKNKGCNHLFVFKKRKNFINILENIMTSQFFLLKIKV